MHQHKSEPAARTWDHHRHQHESEPAARQQDKQPQTHALHSKGKIERPTFWKSILNKSPFEGAIKKRQDMILARDAQVKEADRYAKEKMISDEMEGNFFAYVTDQAMTLHQDELGSPCQESWQCQATLVCHDSQCSACVSTDECAENRVQSVCVTPEESPSLEHNKCLHKRAFPLEWRDWLQIFVCFLVTVIAAPVGIGGGAILVPFFIYFGSFSAHGAIPLSKATILGGAVTNSFLNMQRQHPFSNRPLVDWVSLVLVLPNLLAGNSACLRFQSKLHGRMLACAPFAVSLHSELYHNSRC